VPGSGGASSPPAASFTLGTSVTSVRPSSSPALNGSPDSGAAAISGPGIRASRIKIARLGIDLPIIDGDGIDAPVDKAAHYPGTGWPDGHTNIYVYAHARPGMFLQLRGAIVGDQVDLLLVDGSKRSYIVDQVLPEVPWDAIQYLQPTATEQLTLQTSTAPAENAPRFVVIAHPAP
jgi:LPXTG-site transpeptidase (sortase) family protein